MLLHKESQNVASDHIKAFSVLPGVQQLQAGNSLPGLFCLVVFPCLSEAARWQGRVLPGSYSFPGSILPTELLWTGSPLYQLYIGVAFLSNVREASVQSSALLVCSLSTQHETSFRSPHSTQGKGRVEQNHSKAPWERDGIEHGPENAKQIKLCIGCNLKSAECGKEEADTYLYWKEENLMTFISSAGEGTASHGQIH